MLTRRLLMNCLIVAGVSTLAIPAHASGPPDVAALGALRPGMALDAVKNAMGDRWRGLPPHKGGIIDELQNTHGVVIGMDVDNKIAQISFDMRFTGMVGAIKTSMTPAQATAAMPELIFGPKAVSLGMIEAVVNTNGVLLTVSGYPEEISAISYWSTTATRPVATQPPYPAAVGAPGAPFKDPNLKLCILSELIDQKIIDLGTPQQLVAYVRGKPVDTERAEYGLIQEVYDYLARYPTDQDQLDRVERIYFDGGSTIYAYAWPEWDGESDEFSVHDVSDIGQCRNLRELYFISMAPEVDFSLLKSLAKLEILSADVPIRNIDALLEFPALKKVRIMDDDLFQKVSQPASQTRQLFEALKARGVTVWVHWMSWTGDGAPPAFE